MLIIGGPYANTLCLMSPLITKLPLAVKSWHMSNLIWEYLFLKSIHKPEGPLGWGQKWVLCRLYLVFLDGLSSDTNPSDTREKEGCWACKWYLWGWDSVTWPHLTEWDAGTRSPNVCLGRKRNGHVTASQSLPQGSGSSTQHEFGNSLYQAEVCTTL